MFTLLRPIYDRLDRAAPVVLPTLARFLFAAVLLRYYWGSGLLKLDGLFPSANAYAQILPKAMEAVGYDHSQIGLMGKLIVFAGTYAELILPLMLLLGLLTRPAALGMIGFIIVQSLVDVTGHGIDAATFGSWFDRDPGALVIDQRSLWVLLLSILVFLGSGPISLDRLFQSRAERT